MANHGYPPVGTALAGGNGVFRRATLLLMPVVTLAALGILACTEDGGTKTRTFRESPPPPAAASSELMEVSAAVLGPFETASASACEPHLSDGTAFAVNLEDPNGSGAYKFDPSPLKFKVGERVNFTVTSETEFHTFTVPQFNLDVAVNAKGTEQCGFTFERAGTFELVCIPHRSLGMNSTITVE